MAKVWKKLQRSDADYTGNVTGTVDGESAGNIKTKAIAGAAAKAITDDAFDGSNKLKVANANDALKNANTTATDVGLENVPNKTEAQLLAGNITGTIGGTAVATIKTGAAAGATANQDATSTILGGNLTGTIGGTAVATVKSGAASGATANQDSTSTILGGNLTGSVSGTAVATIKSGAASGATANQDSTSTILGGNLTGSVDGTAVATVKSGAALGTTVGTAFDTSGSSPIIKIANAPSTLKNASISINSAGVLSGGGGGTVSASGLGAVKTDLTNAPDAIKNSETTKSDVGLGNVTNESKSTMFTSPTFSGTVAGVSKSHVGLGSVDNQSASTIQAGTTKANVGLSSVINQAVTVASGKLKLDGTAQTMDADTIDGDSKATVKAAAVSTAETNIIGSAPGALNTLAELATSLGNNASFSSTMTTSLAAKATAPVTISDPSVAPTVAVGVQGIHSDELYVCQDV